MFTLTAAFFAIALVFATVGFGGGTSYIAVLALAGVPYTLIPKLSLICNLLVVTGGSYHFYRRGFFDWRLVVPFIVSSVPMAYLGGSFPLTEKAFFLLLSICLTLCGIRILFLRDRSPEEIRRPSIPVSLGTGALLGLLSGLVGIGGGIFLSPLLINLGWARAKEAAAIASFFILVNSAAGLLGQFSKEPELPEAMTYIPLFLAVIAGGQLGSRIGTHARISHVLVQRGTGILTLFISIRMLLKLF